MRHGDTVRERHGRGPLSGGFTVAAADVKVSHGGGGISGCADLDGDGRDEVLISAGLDMDWALFYGL